MMIDLYPPTPPTAVARPVMLQRWANVTYAHWPVPAETVQRRLPRGIEVDTFDGQAWVGLIAFHMQRIRAPGTPAIPYFGTFPETNVRTYVKDMTDRPGVWFDSLDIARSLPVIVARTSYRLPYMWANMSIAEDGEMMTYSARRRWPGPRGATSRLSIRRGAPIDLQDQSPLERFLTARWGLYTNLGSAVAYAAVEHPPWPLQRAELQYLHDEFVVAAGYDPPAQPPLVHYSTGVDVRIGLPRRLEG